MRVIGFNFTKISAEKSSSFKQGSVITNNLDFLDIDKDKIEMIRDNDVLSLKFQFTITYNYVEGKKETKQGEVLFEGIILAATDKEESKEILKSWKKKEIVPGLKVALFNIIFKKCAVRALELEEEVGLPFFPTLPQMKVQKK